MEPAVIHMANHVALALELVSIMVIAAGGLVALYAMARATLRIPGNNRACRNAWLGMARFLLLGLEFMLAADVVRTAISPDWNDIGQLAAIALIRTFLNHFLERDIETAAHIKEVA